MHGILAALLHVITHVKAPQIPDPFRARVVATPGFITENHIDLLLVTAHTVFSGIMHQMSFWQMSSPHVLRQISVTQQNIHNMSGSNPKTKII
jgi:hypothetical protein